jgi:F420-non-reducing hydrogenase iron-sulfur subunit
MVLADCGIDPARFALQWVSSAEAPRFAELVTEFTEKIRTLGPNPLGTPAPITEHRMEQAS